ncbi:MAG TPA: PQQ-dependent sugar dehydrogenase [Fibrobacteria bacterium]|nr:PQQ-dependent sugar dehydrogenase [Fibrobacteria bacterium]
MGNNNGLPGIALVCLVAVSAHALFKWDGCPDIAKGSPEFKIQPLVTRRAEFNAIVDGTLNEPIKLALAKNGDMYWVERYGAVKVYKGSADTPSVVKVGQLEVFAGGRGALTAPGVLGSTDSEFGIHGLVLDPEFETNRYIYFHYAPKSERDSSLYVSRFKLNGDVLDLTSEKILIKIPQQRRYCCHTGGGMAFDFAGNLFITVGNNTKKPVDDNIADAYLMESNPDADDGGHAGNTNDLRGKILRIKPRAIPDAGVAPEPGPGSTYDIPAGNLFPAGTPLTRGEIWAMGMRNPYTLSVDKYRNWVTWGDVGPDEGKDHEEWNLFTQPGNAGWPYFVGAVAWRPKINNDPNHVVNNSRNNTGLKDLPPAIPATIAYRQNTAITGPIYYYDGANPSTRKFPPNFHKKWFLTDWKLGFLDVATLDDAGKVTERQTLLDPKTLGGPLNMEFGPDGALYIIQYGTDYFTKQDANTKILRVEYTGACRPTTPVLPPTPAALREQALLERGTLLSGMSLGFAREVSLPSGAKGFRLFDVHGRIAWEYRATGHETCKVAIPASLPSTGVLRVQYLR